LRAEFDIPTEYCLVVWDHARVIHPLTVGVGGGTGGGSRTETIS